MSDEIVTNSFNRAFYGKLDAMEFTGKKLVEEHQHRAAAALIAAGLTLIPSEHLRDNEFVVSMGVYKAAKKITGV